MSLLFAISKKKVPIPRKESGRTQQHTQVEILKIATAAAGSTVY